MNVPPEEWILWAPYGCDYHDGGEPILDAFFLAGGDTAPERTPRVFPIDSGVPERDHGFDRGAVRAARLEQDGGPALILADDGSRIWFLPCGPIAEEEPEWGIFAVYKHSNINGDRVAELMMGLP